MTKWKQYQIPGLLQIGVFFMQLKVYEPLLYLFSLHMSLRVLTEGKKNKVYISDSFVTMALNMILTHLVSLGLRLNRVQRKDIYHLFPGIKMMELQLTQSFFRSCIVVPSVQQQQSSINFPQTSIMLMSEWDVPSQYILEAPSRSHYWDLYIIVRLEQNNLSVDYSISVKFIKYGNMRR